MSKYDPINLKNDQSDEELTFKSCCTSLFRLVRAGANTIEEIPNSLKNIADDVVDAWHDSAKS